MKSRTGDGFGKKEAAEAVMINLKQEDQNTRLAIYRGKRRISSMSRESTIKEIVEEFSQLSKERQEEVLLIVRIMGKSQGFNEDLRAHTPEGKEVPPHEITLALAKKWAELESASSVA